MDSPACGRGQEPPDSPQAPLKCLDNWPHEVGSTASSVSPVPKSVCWLCFAMLKNAAIGSTPVESRKLGMKPMLLNGA